MVSPYNDDFIGKRMKEFDDLPKEAREAMRQSLADKAKKHQRKARDLYINNVKKKKAA